MSLKTSKSIAVRERDTKLELIVDDANARVGIWINGTEIARMTTTAFSPLVDSALGGGDLDLGSSGAAGSLDIFPSTASKGKLSITAADSAGDTTTAIVNASQAGARTYTIPDAGASASFVMSEGAQTINGIKTFGSMLRFPVGATVVAAGSDNTDAAPLLEGFQAVSGANGTVGVILPAAGVGAVVGIKGITNGVLKVYPDSGAAINGLTATTGALSLASGLIPAIFVKFTATQWYSFPLVPS